MRDRVLAPRRGTHLPNARTLGYGKYIAVPGDFIWFREWLVGDRDGDAPRSFLSCGRVLGQIIGGNGATGSDGLERCAGMLCVATLGSNLTFGYERWVAPGDVTECLDASRVSEFLAAYLGARVPDLLGGLAANSGILAASHTRVGQIWQGPEDSSHV